MNNHNSLPKNTIDNAEPTPEASQSREDNQNIGNKVARAAHQEDKVDQEKPIVKKQTTSQEKTANQKKTKINLAPRVIMEDFTDIYSSSEINSDQKYISGTEARIEKTPYLQKQQRLANAFEQFFIHGVLNGGWLGRKDTNGITAAATSTCKYDDYRNRIDAFSTLYHRSEKDGKLYASTIGIDVTISGDKKTILDKLTRTSNDNIKRPFGFSKLKYFTNGRSHCSIENVPRYIIGVSEYDVKDIAKLTKFDSRKNLLNFNTNSAKNLEYRYKVLSEMYAENQLYLSRKPEKTVSDTEKEAYSKLTNMDKRLKQALLIASEEIAKKGYLGISEHLTGDRLISAVETKLIERSKQYFKEEQKELQLKRPDLVLDSNHADTYVQIITCTRELMKNPPKSSRI